MYAGLLKRLVRTVFCLYYQQNLSIERIVNEACFFTKVVAKQRALALFEYARQLEKEKQLEEKRRERAMERIAEDIMEANEAKQRQSEEASRALEREVRQAQFKQMQEKGE